MDSLGPLRARAIQLEAAAARERNVALHNYETSARPALKQQAASLKESLSILIQEEAAQRERLEGLRGGQAVAGAAPGVTTGFNVIQSRTDADGRALPIEELRAERQRLVDTLAALGAQVEAAKAEVTRPGARPADREIWETQLVALQDTKRVYRDEINLIEVELLGREHSVRIAAERAAAEASGAAQLTRLGEQLLQTRVKYNRAKYQFYYPFVKGYNIQFGGGGIFGACKNIDISEINGFVTVRGEPGELAADGSVARPARLTVELQAPGAHKQQQAQQPNGTAARPPLSRRSSQLHSGGSGAAAAQQQQQQGSPSPPARRAGTLSRGNAAANSGETGHLRAARQPTPPPLSQQQQPGAAALPQRDGRVAGAAVPARVGALRTSRSAASLADSSAASVDSSASERLLEEAAATAAAGGMQQQQQQQQQQVATPAPHVQPGKADTKGKSAAMRFLSRLGAKKDKYQAKQGGLGSLQPQRTFSEDTEHLGLGGEKERKRSLAGKLLGRTKSKLGGGGGGDAGGGSQGGRDGGSSTGSLDRLAFGSHQLGRDRRRGQGLAGEAIDEEGSDSIADDDASIGLGPDNSGAALENPAAEVHDEGDGSLASDSDSDDERGVGNGLGEGPESPLTQDALRQAYDQQQQAQQQGVLPSAASVPRSGGSSRGGSWLRGAGGSAALDDNSSVFSLDLGADAADSLAAGPGKKGVFVTGRLNDFELTGERGTKCPNLSIGQADVKANVFVRFSFQYDKTGGGWHEADKPQFDVQHLHTKLKGNNVPMPSTLVKHLLRMFIPELIQRRLLPLLPPEFGDYMLTTPRGFEATADVAVVGPALKVLDADLAFEVRGPARTAKEARKQQQKYAAAKEARSMLGLSLPQAQVLAELFGGRSALLDPPRPATIKSLVAFLAAWDRHPHLFDQICKVWNTAYQVVAQRHRGASGAASDFCFRAFMDGPVSQVRRKPARARVIVRSMDVGVNVDGVVTMIHDYTQRTLEELFIKGPVANTRDNPEYHVESLEEQREVLQAWHGWILRELDLFKAKFRGAAASLLGAGDTRGFSLGVENAFYEGPLRLRLPVAMQLDRDGAFSFELPLPSPEGNLAKFIDGFKGLVVPSHLRPPAQAINWIPLTGDPEVDAAMQKQVAGALDAIQGVLTELAERVAEQGLEADDADPEKVLSCPRTKVGDRLGRMIVNRLKVRVRLDERRIGEILQGIDSASMGPAFVSTAGRLLGHLGDVLTLGFTPAAPQDPKAPPDQPPSQYLLQFESSDICRLRADVQSLGFVSLVTPGGMVRLAHAVVTNFLLAFKGATPEALAPVEERFRSWYANMSRAGLDISMCVDAKAGLVPPTGGGGGSSLTGGGAGLCVLRLSGAADDAALRETSPLILVNDLDLVPVGRGMRGDPPPSQRNPGPGPGPNGRW
ncbi:hypothetical protein C2E20_7463 [Micractinium conductrix]|uniref:Uncharacterized protein n=1 Tax=Micractinium conductrix TaxID=554055 RepID=A0A2P6V4G3_9CHLO|nr:hypothetical protein C2E20_7463 [Micractinium conductrix]|eukprot:PSC68967.1 hypothetical protein C2E20_7463 [Micractinium conductrix]